MNERIVVLLFEVAFGVSTLSGCALSHAQVPDMTGAIAVETALVTMGDVAPSPAPSPSPDDKTTLCPAGGAQCNGTGKVRTGDGLAVVDCECGANCQCVATPASLPRRVVCGPDGCQVIEGTVQGGCSNGSCAVAGNATQSAGVRSARPLLRGRRPVRRLFGGLFRGCRSCR